MSWRLFAAQLAGVALILGLATWFLFSEPLRGRAEAGEPTCGKASFYGAERQGKLMANQKPFNRHALTAAMWDVPLGSVWRVTRDGKSVIVTITDRGPKRSLHRLIDLSEASAAALGITIANGVSRVCMERLK